MSDIAADIAASLRIRRADLDNAQDAADVLRLTDHYAQHPMGGSKPLPADVAGRLIDALRAHPTTMIFLAYLDGKAVGIATCFLGFSTFAAKPLVNVHDLAVHRDFQSRGIGRRLLQHVIEQAREQGCASVTLEVKKDNTTGRGLYASLGFKTVTDPLDDDTMLFGKLVLTPTAS